MVVVSQAEAMNPSKRSTMEDVCVIHKPGEWGSSQYTFIGVYDGHGGREMVDFLKYGLSFHVAEELDSNEDRQDFFNPIGRAFLAADAHAHMLGISTSGSTVALCLIDEHSTSSHTTVITANVGDARICLYRNQDNNDSNNDTAYRMTTDHCPALPSERDRIQAISGGFIARGRVCGILAISRSLGDQGLKEYVIAKPCIHKESIGKHEESAFLIIACDGFWDVLSDSQAGVLVHDYVRTGEDKKRTVADFLLKEAIRLGTADNVTIVVAWL